jgi:hypothetical protein
MTLELVMVKVASISLARSTFHPIGSRPYRSLGPFLHGGWIW